MGGIVLVLQGLGLEVLKFCSQGLEACNTDKSKTIKPLYCTSTFYYQLHSRAGQEFWGLNFQTPSLSLAQNLNICQVLGSKINILHRSQKPEETLAYFLKWPRESVFGRLGT